MAASVDVVAGVYSANAMGSARVGEVPTWMMASAIDVVASLSKKK